VVGDQLQRGQMGTTRNFDLRCGPIDAMNASKHSIDQSEDRILQIN